MTESKAERILQDIAGLRSTSSVSPAEASSGAPSGAASPLSPPSSQGEGGLMASLPPAPAGMGGISPGERAAGNALSGSGLAGSFSGAERSGRDVSQAGEEKEKVLWQQGHPFPTPASRPSQEGPYGLRYDFNLGIRVVMPEGDRWRMRFWDKDTDTCLYEARGGGSYVCSRKKYFMHAVIELFEGDELVWTHEYDARGRKVAIFMPVGTLGDPLGWVPYAVRFQEEHDCELTIVTSTTIAGLMGPAYPEVTFMSEKDFLAVQDDFYASYYVGLFFHDEEEAWQPMDFRDVGLHRTAAWILGLQDKTEIRPRVVVDDPETRPMEEPYVVVAVQASCACKMWHNPTGWLDTVAYLRKMGYRVVCIDKDPVVGDRVHWNALPNGVQDETGERPLSERARWLKHAEFFVGLSSGLAWLAWAAGTPVVLISGFTAPYNEFHTPYRVFSTHGCNSCWHDIRTPFQHDDYLFCPRHKGTERVFECTRIIGVEYVISTIKRLCRDHGYQPPIMRHDAPCPEGEEEVARLEEKQKKEGLRHRHALYWEL